MKLKWPFRSRAEPKNETTLDESCVSDVLLQAILSGTPISKQQALSIPAVAAAVEKITNTISIIPFKLYREEDDGDGKKVVTMVEDPRVNLINDDTKDTMDGIQFKKQLSQDYLIGKGGYAYINRSLNRVISIHYVDESYISVQINTDPIFKRYTLSVNGQSYEPFDFIKIIRSTKDGASGESLISEVNSALQTSIGMLKYQLGIVQTGGNKKGFIKSKTKLSPEATVALKDAWKQLYSDSGENVVLLNNGLEFQESSNTSLEMQLNESKISLNNEINAIFGISDDQERYFKFAIMPIVKALESALNRDLLLETEKKQLFWAADMSEITRIDMKSRYDAYQVALASHWITGNEVRYRENMDPLEGLDNIDVGLGSVMLNTKDGSYYVPNTGQQADPNSEQTVKGGE